MPVMGGFALLKLMQQDPKLREIPVVIMSANESNDMIADCLSKDTPIQANIDYRRGSQGLPSEAY